VKKMICSNCQNENVESAVFCSTCGSKLGVDLPKEDKAEITSQEEVAASLPTPVPTGTVPSVSTPAPANTGMVAPPIPAPIPVAAQKPKKKRSKAPLIILLILIALALISAAVFAFGKGIAVFKSPEEKLVDALFKTYEARSGEVYSTFKFKKIAYESGNPEQDKIMVDLLKDLELKHVVRFDGKKQELEGELEIDIKGTNLAKIGYYLNNTYLIVDAPIAYEKPIAIDLSSILMELRSKKDTELGDLMDTGLDMSILDTASEEPILDLKELGKSYKNYKDMYDRDLYKSYKKLDWTPYKKYMISYYKSAIDEVEKGRFEMDFDDNESYRGSAYSIDYDRDDVEDLSDDLFEVFIEDEHIRDLIEEVIDVIIKRVIDNKDYIMYAILAEEDFEDVEEWDKSYKKEMKGIKKDLLDDVDDAFDDLEDNREEKKDEALENADIDINTLLDDAKIKQTIQMDKAGYVRSSQMEIEGTMEEEEGTVISFETVILTEGLNFDDDVDIKGMDKKDALDYSAMSAEEKGAFNQELMMKLYGEFQSNPIFSEATSFGN